VRGARLYGQISVDQCRPMATSPLRPVNITLSPLHRDLPVLSAPCMPGINIAVRTVLCYPPRNSILPRKGWLWRFVALAVRKRVERRSARNVVRLREQLLRQRPPQHRPQRGCKKTLRVCFAIFLVGLAD